MLLLLLLSHFSRVRLCATPSLGFSRQEHWSWLPFPSPMHKSEKWKRSCSVMSDSSRPHGLKPTRFLCPWDFPGKSTGVECHCLLRTGSIHIYKLMRWCWVFPGCPVVKNLPCNARDTGSIPSPGRSHMPWDKSLCATATELTCPRAFALPQEKPLLWEACTLQWRVALTCCN